MKMSRLSMLQPWSRLTSWQVGFHVPTSATSASVPDWPESIQDSGGTWCEPFAWFDRATSLWRTWQRCVNGEWALYLATWPKAGMTRNGIAYRRQPLERRCDVNGSIWLPNLNASEYKGASRKRYKGSPHFRGTKMSEGLRTCEDDPQYLDPSFAEAVMGYPISWTDLGGSVTPWCLP